MIDFATRLIDMGEPVLEPIMHACMSACTCDVRSYTHTYIGS